MRMNYKGWLLPVAVATLCLGGCTYDENDLRGTDASMPPPQDSGESETMGPVVIDAAALVGIDASALDGKAVDVAPVDAQRDAPELDVGVDAPAGGIDGLGEVQAIDGSAIDATDAPITGSDAAIDGSPIDGTGTEAGKVDAGKG
jgi:hypothetical protein